MNVLAVNNIRKKGHQGKWALGGVSLQQNAGQQIAITGETGSGKTTLLKIIAGLIQPDEGEVLLDGVRVKGPEEQLLPGHPKIAYLSQQHELRNHYRVEELQEMASRVDEETAAGLYRRCKVDGLLQRKSSELSGGERQRIALANLLLSAPELLLLDEPFSNLDPVHKQVLKEVLRYCTDELGMTIILSSHEPMDTLSWADEIIVLKAGRVVQQGKPEDIYFMPEEEYVARLFGRCNHFPLDGFSGFFPIPDALLAIGTGILIRPECLVLSAVGNGLAKAGVVVEVYFLGCVFESMIRLADGLSILVWSMEPPPTVGQSVFVSVRPGAKFSLLS
ncbi:MAG: ABC transporter ATP-binding protein [Bacteroidetes bacterium]|nr:ABC transporter ATP-binding protein [Bacteroidota bacterium]